ncbi:ester cyclase [Roseomonas sp. GCM10028921]
MASITHTAQAFLEACESGGGWQGCVAYCHPDASFACQADALADIRTLQAYTEWMKRLLGFMPDGRYTLKSFAADEARRNVVAFATFHGTHTGEGGPMPPTGKHTDTDYVYVMDFDGEKIRHMTKVWNDGRAIRELGWTG